MRLRPVAFLVLLVTVQVAAAAAPAWPHEQSELAPTARVTWGRLESGFRYALLPHPVPAGRVSLRLLVNAGSLHEADDQRGYAHFVEHMAFNGTRRHPAGQLVRALQSVGISFGPHANAYTSYTNTTYKLELPASDPEALARGLDALRDFADGILFEAREVRQERGVVLSERLARQTSERAWNDAMNRFLYEGTRVPLRAPIGTEAALREATPDRLRTFYRTWYRPERMVLVVAGDVNPALLTREIEARFRGLEGHGPAPVEPGIGDLSEGAGRISIHAAPRAGVEFDLFSIRVSPTAPDTAERRREELRLNTALAMLRERLRRIQARPGSPLSNFAVRQDRVFNSFDRLFLTAVGPAKRWQEVLGVMEQELRRALDHGFDPTELAACRTSLRAAIRAAATEAPTRGATELADDLTNAIDSGRVFQLADEERDAKLAQLETLTVEQCWQALKAVWQGGTEMLFVGVDPAAAPSLSATHQALEASRAVPVAAPGPIVPVSLAYSDFGDPGIALEQRQVEDLGVFLIRFANGVRLNVRPTALEKNIVRFRLRIGQGRALEPASLPGISQWAGPGWIHGGLRRQSLDEVVQAMNGRVGAFGATMADDALILAGQASSEDLDFFLRLATAFISDPAFEPSARERVVPFLNALYSDLGRSASGPSQRAVLPFLAGGDPRFGIPAYEVVSAQGMDDLKAWLGPQLAADPLEVTLVGDITADAARAVVARSLGTLPPRRETLTEVTPPSPPLPPALRRFRYQADLERPSTVSLYWPVRDQPDPAARRRLDLLADILGDRVRLKTREEMGATYAPRSVFQTSEAHPGFAHLRCELQVQTASARRLLDVVAELAAQLARRGVQAEELERARVQALARLTREEESNRYWLEDVVSGLDRYPQRLEAARAARRDIEAVTVAELNALAARVLAPKNLFRFIIDPKL